MFHHLRSHRVFNPHNSNACKAGDNIIFIIPLWFWFSCWEISECKTYGSQAFWCHRFNHSFYNIITVPWSEHFCLTISTQDFEAPKRKCWIQTSIINKNNGECHLSELEGLENMGSDIWKFRELRMYVTFYILKTYSLFTLPFMKQTVLIFMVLIW